MTKPTIKELADALEPFARVWLVNEQFSPSHSIGMREYVAGIWPTMGECKRAHDLLEALGHEFQ